MESIKSLRVEKKLTQAEAAILTDIPLRTFKLYENDSSRVGSIKYNYIIDELSKYGFVDETHGILSEDEIIEACSAVFKKYPVEYAILFGSYARGDATDISDVDILVSSDITGLSFYGLTEDLRAALKKKVDLLDLSQLNNNPELLNEILRDGVRIYGKRR
jgi:predicted nucleotidyltransferase